ncbi:MAG TPA: ABC transporter permease [Xanthobacteraceae bacterium]|jgi:ABC-type nitrate/sulfonate/bicarbonate transport system permease component|nr:ABC transporter permease [Xanthobacteraceae bacterium]
MSAPLAGPGPEAVALSADGVAEDVAPDIEELGPPPRSHRNKIIRLVSVVGVLVAWEAFGRQIDPLFMSYPTAIGTAAIQMIRSGELTAAFLDSLGTLLLGFFVAAVSGIGIGLLIGRYRTVEAATDWLVNALYATPLVAIIPLVVLWFGLGFSAKLFIVVILAIFPILINTAAGVRNVPQPLLDVGFAFDATERQLFTKFILPASLPYMMTGLRLGVGRAIIGMVVAEFFTAITGLGALIVKYGNQYDTAAMFVPILTLMLLGVTLTALMRRLESWIAPWKDTVGD